MNSIFKIYKIKEGSKHEELSKFVLDNFSEEVTINCAKLIRWCCKSKTINRFFRVIKKEVNQLSRGFHNKKLKTFCESKDMSCFIYLETSQKLESNPEESVEFEEMEPINEQRAEMTRFCQTVNSKLSGNSNTDPIANINCNLRWVYGIRVKDMMKSFCYNNDHKGRGTSEKIIYACSKIVVIFLHKLNEQRHYTKHKSEVSCLTASRSSFVASGEGNCNRPSIHIWDINTLKNLCEFTGYHTSDICLLEFLKNDTLLASCSLRSDTPIFIFDRIRKTVVFSYRINDMVRGIAPINILPDKNSSVRFNRNKLAAVEDNFIVFSKSNFYYFNQNNLHSVLRGQNIKKFKELASTSITATLSYMESNDVKEHTQALDETFRENAEAKSVIVLTGHTGGIVFLWVGLIPEKILFNLGSEVVEICLLNRYICFATEDFKVHITNTSLKGILKTIDLTPHTPSLFSNSIKNLVPTHREILLNTYKGDFLKISIMTDSNGEIKTKEKKIMNLACIEGVICGLTSVEKEEDILTFICYNRGYSMGFSSENHDIIDYWSQDNVAFTCMESAIINENQILLFYGTQEGTLLIRECQSDSPQEVYIGSPVTSIVLAHNLQFLVLTTANHSVYFLRKVDGVRSKFSQLDLAISPGEIIPTSINLNEDLTTLFITTDENLLLKLNIQGYHLKDEIDEDELINIRRGIFSYSSYDSEELTKQIFLTGNDFNFILMTDSLGNLIVYQDLKSLEKNCPIFCLGHSSQISNICVSSNKDSLMTSGLNDQSLLEWKVSIQTSQGEFYNEAQINLIEAEDTHRDEVKENLIIRREIEFCTSTKESNTLPNDSFVRVRGYKEKNMNFLASNYTSPYEENDYLEKRVPAISMRLNHVYGIECFNRRNTIFYLHYHPLKQAAKQEQLRRAKLAKERRQKMEEVPLHPNYIKEMLFSKYSALPYDKKHTHCTRKICYFVSRVAVISPVDSNERNQKFYEGHRAQISCMSIHPSKMIVATGEAAKRPQIHVWSAINCSLITKLDTYHTNGVLNMCFSYDGFYLISVGLDSSSTIQVTDWRGNKVVSVRHTSNRAIMGIAVNPYDRNKFSTCGDQRVQIWEVRGRSIELEENIQVPKKINCGAGYLVTICYIYYLLGDTVMTDLVVGNSFGDIGLVTCSKYIVMKKNAHRGMINCLKISDVLAEDLMVVSSGEDELIKFWDTSFNLLKVLHLRNIRVSSIDRLMPNISAQSIDFHACSPRPKTEKINSKDKKSTERGPIRSNEVIKQIPKILLCNRDGDILELYFSCKWKGELPAETSEEERQKYQEESIEISLRKRISYHATEQMPSNRDPNQIDFQYKKLYFSVDQAKQYLYTLGTDGMIKCWNLKDHTNESHVPENLDEIPSFSTLTPGNGIDGLRLFAVGFRDGRVILRDQNYKLVQTIENPGYEVLSVVFSPSCSYLAISYISFNRFNEDVQGIDSFIDLFELQDNKLQVSQDESQEVIYPSYRKIDNNITLQTDRRINQTLGAYFMAFDIDEQSLVMNFQVIDHNLNRDLENKDLFLQIYSLKSGSDESNKGHASKIQKLTKDRLVSLKFQTFEFSNFIHSKRIVLDKVTDPSGENRFREKEMLISAMGDFGEWIVLGSSTGDLSVVKKSALYFPESMAVDQLESHNFCQAKNYIGHSGPIDSIKLAGDKMFTSEFHQEVVFEWQIIQGKLEWERDHSDKWVEDAQEYYLREIEPKVEYDKIVNESLPLRNEIVELKQNIDESVAPEIELKLEKIIGRKAFNRRNNLFYTADNKLVFAAASLIVEMKIPPEGYQLTEENSSQFFTQQFLDPDSKEKYSISPSISTFCLSYDRKYICIGTTQTKAKVITWELTSRTFLGSLVLDDCCVILKLCYSDDRSRILCLAQTKHYTQCIYFIEEKSLNIIACSEFFYSLPIKIKDLAFMPKRSSEFISIGYQHMSYWQVKGENLSFRELPIESSDELIQREGFLHVQQELAKRRRRNKDHPQKDEFGNDIFPPLEVGFLGLIFLFDSIIITAGDDGYVIYFKINFIVVCLERL